MLNNLIKNLASATELPEGTISKMLTRPQQRDHGDLAFPCFPLAKSWKVSPPECAKRLAEELELPDEFSSAEAIGPYLNFRYERSLFFKSLLPSILEAQDSVGALPVKDKKVIVEYSSPNIAKTFHVGHLRTTLIGRSLSAIYKHQGYEVISINHLGDWGTQFGFVWAGCELWGKPENATVEELVELYRRATLLKKAQEEDCVKPEEADLPDVNKMAREYFIKLEQGAEEETNFWQWCLDVSVNYLKALYARLGISFDHYTGESFYRDMLPQVEEDIRNSGILEDSRGALGVDCGKKLGFARIFTEDGRSLYITRDIATAIYRTETFKPESILYVVAAAQSLHFNQLLKILEKMKHPAANLVKHVAFGFVPGMKTREGGGISLKDYLDEAKERALEVYRSEVSKRPEGVDEEDIAEKVAIGATYYYFLSHSNVKDFQFSWKEALNFQGDSGPYLQYALARLNSIKHNASEAGFEATSNFKTELLAEDSAFELGLLLADFSKIVEKACKDNEPYHIALYLVELAKAFSRAYRELKVLNAESIELSQARFSLFMAVKNTLSTGLKLIAVPAVEKM